MLLSPAPLYLSTPNHPIYLYPLLHLHPLPSTLPSPFTPSPLSSLTHFPSLPTSSSSILPSLSHPSFFI